jgi:hypothetical protein
MTKALLNVLFACGLLSVTGYTSMAQVQSAVCPVAGKSVRLVWASSLAGCPFSAVIETERTQTLADGTHVQTKNRDLIYRDSLGRLRWEMYAPTNITDNVPSAPTVVQIYDPVAGFAYSVRPQSAIAYRTSLDEAPTNPKAAAQPQNSSARASASSHAEQSRSKQSVKQLEPQEMEGILVTGTQTTWAIPAGAEGNDRDLTVVQEIWISLEMGITLLDKNSDPRSGNRESRMTNLERAEPDAALFQVPADYTIKSQ